MEEDFLAWHLEGDSKCCSTLRIRLKINQLLDWKVVVVGRATQARGAASRRPGCSPWPCCAALLLTNNAALSENQGRKPAENGEAFKKYRYLGKQHGFAARRWQGQGNAEHRERRAERAGAGGQGCEWG